MMILLARILPKGDCAIMSGMTIKKFMRVGRKRKPDKMRQLAFRVEPELIESILKRAGKGKTSAWIRAVLWLAVKKK